MMAEVRIEYSVWDIRRDRYVDDKDDRNGDGVRFGK